MKTWIYRAVAILLFSVGLAGQSMASMSAEQAPADEQSIVMPLPTRILIATKLYNAIECSFAQWTPELRSSFESEYQFFIDTILKDGDRRSFDLAAMRLVASLHNGHSFFTDPWLEDQYGAPLGFKAQFLDKQWVITESEISNLPPGSIIDTLNGMSVEVFFGQNQPYIPDSSERAQKADFFSLGILFPQEFSLGLRDGRTVTINRKKIISVSTSASGVTGRWLQDGSVAYIKIPSFEGVSSEASALAMVRTFKAAPALIVDLRGNPGGRGNPPDELQMAFMDKPYRTWIERSRTEVGRLASLHYSTATLDSGPVWMHPEGRPGSGIFEGKLLLLVDRECASYCEEFVLPLKLAGRAELVGETTAGTNAQTQGLDLGSGMRAVIAVTQEVSPDGTPFEGIGINPTVEVKRTLGDIRTGADVVLQSALRLIPNR